MAAIGGRAGRATTIIDFSTNTSGTIVSRPHNRPPDRRIVQEDVQDPQRLTRMLNDLQEDVSTSTAAVQGNPHAAPCILRSVAFTAGQSKTLTHTLGRAWTGWWIVRAQTNAASFTEGTLPAGVKSDTAIQLVSGNAGTYDIAITGD